MSSQAVDVRSGVLYSMSDAYDAYVNKTRTIVHAGSRMAHSLLKRSRTGGRFVGCSAIGLREAERGRGRVAPIWVPRDADCLESELWQEGPEQVEREQDLWR